MFNGALLFLFLTSQEVATSGYIQMVGCFRFSGLLIRLSTKKIKTAEVANHFHNAGIKFFAVKGTFPICFFSLHPVPKKVFFLLCFSPLKSMAVYAKKPKILLYLIDLLHCLQ